MSPFFVAFFAFCFALACGAIWEIFEYLMDVVFGTDMQKSGLNDTMADLIVDSAGAVIISVIGYFFLRDSKNDFLRRAIAGFLHKNPNMKKKLEEQISGGKNFVGDC